MYTSENLQKIQDEINSLKVVQPLNGGALTKYPATATWTGIIDKNAPISEESMLAAFIATFERSDGELKAPLVQFYYFLTPGYTNNARTYDATVAIGLDNVSHKIILRQDWWPFGDSTTGTVTLTVSALSLVEGNITIERVYS